MKCYKKKDLKRKIIVTITTTKVSSISNNNEYVSNWDDNYDKVVMIVMILVITSKYLSCNHDNIQNKRIDNKCGINDRDDSYMNDHEINSCFTNNHDYF